MGEPAGMALIVRIDVDRPYGRRPFVRHLLSRISSDAFLPRIEAFGYLNELKQMLQVLNDNRARSYVFFRRCTLPSQPVLELLEQGRHEIGLHLENSRSFDSFTREKQNLERHVGKKVRAVSKHGSGGAKYGYHHRAAYEPEKYVQWARQCSMRLFSGNLEDPTIEPVNHDGSLAYYPSAFWLEPHWRDTATYTVDWLMREARKRDVIMLVHPENVLASTELTQDFKRAVANLETRILE
jgi:hypothetical protein